MKIKGIVEEDFTNYKVPSMFIGTSKCSFKCETESGIKCCQNSSLATAMTLDIDDSVIIEKYLNNPISKAIVFGGLEPLDTFDEVTEFIAKLRYQYHCDNTVVIYTGYNKTEILLQLSELKKYGNIIVKFGRYIPNDEQHFDEILGVTLASSNQYAEVLC